MSQPTVKVFPHNPDEFPRGAEELRKWIVTELKERKGLYQVPSHRPLYSETLPGFIVLFMKDKKLVGEGIVKEDFRKHRDEDKRILLEHGDSLINPNGKLYEGVITFEPSSLRGYRKMLDLDTLKRLTGESISYRSGGEFKNLGSYVKLISEVSKAGFC